jgi:hypothetical protein
MISLKKYLDSDRRGLAPGDEPKEQDLLTVAMNERARGFSREARCAE